MELSTVIAISSAVILVATGIAAYRRDKSSASAVITDSAVGWATELREDNATLRTENRQQELDIEWLKSGSNILIGQLRGHGHEPLWTPDMPRIVKVTKNDKKAKGGF